MVESDPSLLEIEIRYANAHGGFDDDDFAERREFLSDEDVDVLASRAVHFDHRTRR